jgi:hypothetical protein
MFQDIDDALFTSKHVQDIFSGIKADHSAFNVAYAKRMQVAIESQQTITRAKEEADEDIRVLCRALITQGRRVCVLTNDASLILGVPSAVEIFSPSRGHLMQCSVTGAWRLQGPLLSVETMLQGLERYVRALFPVLPPSSRLDSTSLCYVAALLGGEGGRGSISSKAEDPYYLLFFASSYLFHRRLLVKTDFLFKNKPRLLVAAVALIMGWRGGLSGGYSHCSPVSTPDPVALGDHFSSLVSGVVAVARDVATPCPKCLPLCGLPRGNPDGMFKLGSEAKQLSVLLLTKHIVTRLHETMVSAFAMFDTLHNKVS